MPVFLDDLLNDPALHLVAHTPRAWFAGRAVRWVAPSELDDPTPWLDGGELVLTTGLRLRGRPRQAVVAYAQRLAAVPVAGLGFATGLSHRVVPPALAAAAADAGLPLFEVPYDTPFVALTRLVAERLFAEQYEAVRALARAQDDLTQAVLSGGGLPALIRTLGRLARAPVSVIDADGAVVAADPPRSAWPVEQVAGAPGHGPDLSGTTPGLSGTAAEHSFVIKYLTKNETSADLWAAPIRVAGETVAHLCCRGPSARARELLGFTLNLVGLELARRQAVLNGRRELVGQVLADLVRAVVPERVAERRLRAHGVGFDVPNRVLLGRVDCPPDRLRTVPWRVEAGRAGPDDPLVTALVDGLLVLVVPAGGPYRETARVTVERLARLGGDARVGIGGPHPGAGGLRLSFLEAREALTQGPGVSEREPLNLGSLLLANLDLPLRELGEEILRPLTEHDAHHGGGLVETLRAYLAADCVPGATAAALFVHRNTLRYRLGQIERLTGRDLGAFQDRMHFWLALTAVRVAGGPAPGDGPATAGAATST